MEQVWVKHYEEPRINRKEILRYMGCREETAEIAALVDSCLQQARDRLSYRVCACEFPLSVKEDELDLAFAKTKSRDLRRNLQGCERLLLFAATIGIEMDRMIVSEERRSVARAVCLQAIGAERIESLCGAFNREMREKYEARGCSLRPRFSPGFGDLSLSLQKDIFRALDCPRKIGATLKENDIMAPSKSVTAIIGIKKEEA